MARVLPWVCVFLMVSSDSAIVQALEDRTQASSSVHTHEEAAVVAFGYQGSDPHPYLALVCRNHQTGLFASAPLPMHEGASARDKFTHAECLDACGPFPLRSAVLEKIRGHLEQTGRAAVWPTVLGTGTEPLRVPPGTDI